MSFAKNVHKYQKWVLGSIVAIMALTLVVSGNIGDSDTSGGNKPYAKIFNGSVTVTEREWHEALRKAGAWFRLKAVRDIDEGADFNSQQLQPYIFKFREGPGMLAWHELFKFTDEDREAAAKELIILGYDARAKQVRASEEEIDHVIQGYLDRAGVSDTDVDKQVAFADQYFRADRDSFRAAVRDSIMIEKALTLDVGGTNVRYEDVYAEKLASSRSVKVLVAAIDGGKLPADIVPVTDDEIRSRFEMDRDKYKMPTKAQVEYLMVSFDDLKSRIKDPTPAEIQKYYEDHRREFLKPAKEEEGHHEGDGHDHSQHAAKEEVKPLDDALREEIIKKIKDQQAQKDGWTLVSKLSSTDYAKRWYKILEEEKAKDPKDSKERALARTGTIFGELRDKYQAEGVTLRNGITMPFDKNDRAPFEEALGKSTASDPHDWVFTGPVGEVAHQVYRSDKGYALIRIANKTEGYATDLTAPVRAKIRQDLAKEGAGGRARRLADELVGRIRTNGPAEIAKLRNRTDVKIQHSTYVSQTTPDADAGLSPGALAQQVKSKFLKESDPAAPGAPVAEAQAVHGDTMGGDRKDWSYVIVVEDSVQVAPEIRDDEFMGDVRRHEIQELAKKRSEQAGKLVASAEWKKAEEKPAE